MPQVPGATIKARAAALRVAAERRLALFHAAQIGRTTTALVERHGVGRTANYATVTLDPTLPPGRILRATVTGVAEGRLIAAAALDPAALDPAALDPAALDPAA
jgi:threonylcarbamoyladenosine tRNA methylthiotransferase MtaB